MVVTCYLLKMWFQIKEHGRFSNENDLVYSPFRMLIVFEAENFDETRSDDVEAQNYSWMLAADVECGLSVLRVFI